VKVVTRKDNGQILGAQFMCEHSTDMISQASLAIANKMTAKDMLRYMRPHPTFEEALTAAVENAAE
jgi:dihydrolipoamide dehydrogenase